MGKNWGFFYDKKFTITNYLDNLDAHALLFEEILEEKPKNILEVGSGTGSMSIFLNHLGYNVVSVDKDKKVLYKAKKLCKRFNGRVIFSLCDAFVLSNKFKPSQFDVVFSQGFFEHFNNNDIKKLLEEQLKVGKVVIFSVPSKYYPTRDFGNERLLSKEQWAEILHSFNFKVEFLKYYCPTIWLRKLIKDLFKYPGSPLRKPLQILIKIVREKRDGV